MVKQQFLNFFMRILVGLDVLYMHLVFCQRVLNHPMLVYSVQWQQFNSQTSNLILYNNEMYTLCTRKIKI